MTLQDTFNFGPLVPLEIQNRKKRARFVYSRLLVLSEELGKESRWGFPIRVSPEHSVSYQWRVRVVNKNVIYTIDVDEDVSLDACLIEIGSRLCPEGCLFVYNNELVK